MGSLKFLSNTKMKVLEKELDFATIQRKNMNLN